jgi:hypothetical protein
LFESGTIELVAAAIGCACADRCATSKAPARAKVHLKAGWRVLPGEVTLWHLIIFNLFDRI